MLCRLSPFNFCDRWGRYGDEGNDSPRLCFTKCVSLPLSCESLPSPSPLVTLSKLERLRTRRNTQTGCPVDLGAGIQPLWPRVNARGPLAPGIATIRRKKETTQCTLDLLQCSSCA
jgi:hypothetical protein